MRILIAPEWYPWEDRPYHGVFCREQAQTVAGNHDVVVLTWRMFSDLGAPLRIEETDEDGLRTFRVRFRHSPLPKLDGAFKLAGCLGVMAKLRARGWSPDLIHAHEYEAGRTALLLSTLVRVPVVVTEHYSGFALGTVPASDLRRARNVFERAAVVCPVSRDLERHLREVAPRARFEPVPNSVDEQVFNRDDGVGRRHGGPLQLVAVGSLVEIKGHRHLIEALPRIRSPRGVGLDIIGDGPLREELVQMSRSLGLKDRVRFLGPLTKPQVAAALRRADVFVLPSLWETQSCALIEALACGLPAVASNVGGVPEVLDESNGVAVAPGSADALAAGIETVAARLEAYDSVRISAATRSVYGYRPVARRWGRLYLDMLRPRGA
jgi:glycosyltransferase involved in cell wall biosynthesis